MHPIILGETVRDVVSGFQGKAIGRSENLYAVPMILIAPEGLHDCRPVRNEWFDEPRVERVLIPDAPAVAPAQNFDDDVAAPGADCSPSAA